MYTAAYRGKGSKGRAAVSGDWPCGAAGCQQRIQVLCQPRPAVFSPSQPAMVISYFCGRFMAQSRATASPQTADPEAHFPNPHPPTPSFASGLLPELLPL